MKVEKIYGVGSNIQVSFTQATVSDTVKIASLGQEKADVVVTEKKPIVQYYVAPRCNGKSFTQLVKEMKNDAVLEPFIDASVIKGTSDLRPIVIDASEIKAPIGTIITMSEPKKIIRSGEYTTVLWMDGTKTIVKRMPGSEDSDYAAFTAALAKKVYGTNSKVERIVAKTERVKTKAEKKAEKKAKHKAESEKSGERKYIVSQYGQVAEWKGIETDSTGVGEKVIVFANNEGEARCKAVDVFRKSSLLKEWLVLGNGSVCEVVLLNAADSAGGCFGIWTQSCIDKNYFKTCVFAKDREEAKKALTIIRAPDPIPF